VFSCCMMCCLITFVLILRYKPKLDWQGTNYWQPIKALLVTLSLEANKWFSQSKVQFKSIPSCAILLQIIRFKRTFCVPLFWHVVDFNIFLYCLACFVSKRWVSNNMPTLSSLVRFWLLRNTVIELSTVWCMHYSEIIPN